MTLGAAVADEVLLIVQHSVFACDDVHRHLVIVRTARSIVSLSCFIGMTLILLDGIRASTKPGRFTLTRDNSTPRPTLPTP